MDFNLAGEITVLHSRWNVPLYRIIKPKVQHDDLFSEVIEDRDCEIVSLSSSSTSSSNRRPLGAASSASPRGLLARAVPSMRASSGSRGAQSEAIGEGGGTAVPVRLIPDQLRTPKIPQVQVWTICRLFLRQVAEIFASGRQRLEYCTTFKYSNATKSAGFLDMPKLCSLWFLYLTDLLVKSCATVALSLVSAAARSTGALTPCDQHS
jgi:hypothetical protein